MALTGLDIFKQLPKKNCKECGQPTCLAFAMQLAAGKAALDACPYVSDAAREVLDSASAPPVALIKIGVGEKAFQLGNETVLFRHEKRFEHPAGIAIKVSDTEDVKAKVEKINKLVFERVGQRHEVNMVAVTNDSRNAVRFADAVKAAQDAAVYPLLLISGDPEAISKALQVAGANRPVIAGADAGNYEAMAGLAREYDAPLVVKGTDLNSLAGLVEKIVAMGYKNLILDSGAREFSGVIADQTQIRRSALKKFRPFGYPTIAFANNADPIVESLNASSYIAKYAGIVVMESTEPQHILPVITLRMNIYTDPQKPIAVESKIYEVLNPGPDSPVLITTNFSLTYFCVAGDAESSRLPAYIVPVDTDGVSVLTAWAADKLTAETIADTVKRLCVMDKVNHRKIILPGGVAVLSGKTAELTGCEVMVGPNESAGIPSFFKKVWVNQ
jgi:acetyl-CoA decarbonylase/synthase complex subunit gamma